MSLQLGYWGIRGRGQITRLVCAHTGVNWTDKTYMSPQEWFGKDRAQLGLPFPNLPYIVDGDIKITQSDVLPRYVIKKSGKTQLLGNNPRDAALVDNVIYAVADMWLPIIQICFDKKWEDNRTALFYTLKSKLSKLDKFINGKDTVLNYLTLADFHVAQFSYYVQKLFPNQYGNYKTFSKVRYTIESLPGVKAYYQKQNAVQAAFLPPNLTAFPFFHSKFQSKMPLPPPKSLQKSNSSSPTKKIEKQIVINNGQKLKILLISGSLRKASTNTGLLRACVELNNPHLQFQWADISQVPIFNEDIQVKGVPQVVVKIKQQAKKSHGILFGCPEYNHSISACLKNIYDWLSRGKDTPMTQIPAGMISSGISMGGARGQKALKIVAQYNKVKFMQKPQICVKRLQGKYFDEDGNLIDEKIRQNLKQYLMAFAKWVDSHKKK